MLKFRSRKSCCLSALRALTVTVFYSACICCVVWCLIGMIFKNTTQLTAASLAGSCQHSIFNFRTRGFSDPPGVAKTVSRGGQKFSKAVQLPDSRRQVAPWINYKKSGHYSQIWSLHFNDFCCVFSWPTQSSTKTATQKQTYLLTYLLTV